MLLFVIFYFILYLNNVDIFLLLNFIKEFFFLYKIFQRLPIINTLVYSFILLSIAYSINMFTKICFVKLFSKFFIINIFNLNKYKFYILFIFMAFIIIFNIYFFLILNSLYYNISYLIYTAYSL